MKNLSETETLQVQEMYKQRPNVANNTAGKQAGGLKWKKIIWSFRKIA